MEEPSVHGDRLSELPECLIHHILSFLHMRDVISTSLLSKRWENLWTTVPCLNFCETIRREDYDENDCERRIVERLKNFVNRALIFWRGSKILKFKIDIPYHLSLDSDDINVWTLFALKNKVEDLEIKSSGEILAPQCLNKFSSIRKLSLEGCDLQIIGPPSWNQLKSLKIMFCDVQGSGEDLVNRVLLGSPQLEVFELQLENNSANLNIRSRSLKKLKIANYLFTNIKDEPSLDTLRICCPNLETLEISGLFGSYLFTDVSSLIDATLDFSIDWFSDGRWFSRVNELLGEPLKQVLSTIQHVEKVTISCLCAQVFGALHKKDLLPPLPNVKFLKLDLRRFGFGHLMDLLGSFPNLKMLVIDHDSSYMPPGFKFNIDEVGTNLSKSFLLQLKIVEIYAFIPDYFGLIEFLLKRAIKLEKLMLWPRGAFLCEEKQKLMSMSTSSPIVQVILKESN